MIRKDRVVPFIGLALIAAIALTGCSMSLDADSSGSTPSASATPSASPTTKPASDKQPDAKDAAAAATLDESVWGHLTWKYPTRYADLVTKYYGDDSMLKLKKDSYPTFVVGSNESGKVWTDSVRPPLSTKSIEEVYAHILAEPDYGAQVASGLAHSSITGGKSLLELNPWLEEFKDPAGINDWAQAAVDGTPADQLVAAKKLVLVVMLLEQLHSETVETLSTSLNYHLVVGESGGAMTVNPNNPDAIKEFELSPVQYKGEFVTIQLAFKGQTGCWLKVGFNTGDGRFAGFTCETPTATPPPVVVTPGCTTDCGGTPPCKINCGTPPCTTNCGGGEKTSHVPAETTPDGGTEPLAPAPSGPAAPAEEVDTTPVTEVDTGTDLPTQDTGGENSGTVSE